MTRVLRVAVLGTAHVHFVDHLAVLRADVGVRLVAVYDRDPAAVEGLAGLPRVDSVARALSGADVALIDSTTAEHAELVASAAGLGLAAFVEKPLAADAGGTRALAAVIDAAGMPFATGMFLRCAPSLRRARDLLADGALGTLSAVHARFTHGGFLDGAFTGSGAWMLDPVQGGIGGFADLGVHLLDALRWLRPGAPISVRDAELIRVDGQQLDVGGAALLDWAGTPATVHAGWIGRPGGLHLHLEGTSGSVTVCDGELTLHLGHRHTEVLSAPGAGAALAAFLAGLRGQHAWEPPTTSDVIATAELVDAVATRATP